MARVPADRVVFVQPDYPALADGARAAQRAASLRTDDAAGRGRDGPTTSPSAAIERITYVGPGTGASDALRRAAVDAGARRSSGSAAPAFVDAGVGRLARSRRRLARDARRRPAGRRALLRRQAGAGACSTRCARPAVDVPDDIAADRLRRHHPGRSPVVTAADDRRRPIGRRRPPRGGDADDGVCATAAMPASEVLPVSLVVGDSTPPRPARAAAGDHGRRPLALSGGNAVMTTPAAGAPRSSSIDVTKRYGDAVALDGVSLRSSRASSSACSGRPAAARRRRST